MAGSASDKAKKLTNNFSTTLSSPIGSGDVTLTPAAVTNLPTDTGTVFVIDRVDASGNKTPAKREYVRGLISAGNMINVVRGLGVSTALAHSTGAVIEQVMDTNAWNDAIDFLLQDHANPSGYHKQLTDTNGNSIVALSPTTSAVNQITVANAITGTSPIISATGTDANVGITLTPKGTGTVNTDTIAGKTVSNTGTIYGIAVTTGTIGSAALAVGSVTATKIGTDASFAWTAFTPTITSSTGSFTTVSATCRYIQIGKSVTVNIVITITTNGTAAGSITATLPVAISASATAYVGAGRATSISGKMLQGKFSGGGSTVTIFNYDNTYPGATGEVLLLTGTYETA